MHLTKTSVDKLAPKTKGNYIAWDDVTQGLGVLVNPGGSKTFVVDYTTQSGRRHRLAIGRYGVLTIQQAREEAIKMLADVARGSDPISEKQKARKEQTLKEFIEEYLEWTAPLRSEKSLYNLKSRINLYILPTLGSMKLTEVRKADVVRLHQKMKNSQVTANRVVSSLSHIYTTASEWERIPEGLNPARNIKRYDEHHRERYLTDEEQIRLGIALNRYESKHPIPVRALKLLLLTGCRMNQILTLAWENVRLEEKRLCVKNYKGGLDDVLLGEEAIAYLESCDHLKSKWVCPSPARKDDRHITNINRFWSEKAKVAAKLEDVHIHDLRHTVATVGVNADIPLYTVGGLLRHKKAATTQRYAHLIRSTVHDAADKISAEISAALSSEITKRDVPKAPYCLKGSQVQAIACLEKALEVRRVK